MWMSLCLLAPLAWASEKADPAKFIEVRPGNLPIVFSAPHGGSMPIPDTPVRQGINVPRFAIVRDGGTDELARACADALEKKLGGRPFLVVAQFERKYADANRTAKEAYESDTARPIYEAYHQALADSKAKIKEQWGRGLVVDFHGQGVDAKAIFRGTNNGKTAQHLIDRFGKAALLGPKSVFGSLAQSGHRIIPANDSDDAEDTRFSGGYIVQTYGSKQGGTIDAIQFEFGAWFRQEVNRARVADDVANAVAIFAREYLPLEKTEQK